MDRSLEVTSVEPTFSPVACPITQVLKDSGEPSVLKGHTGLPAST